MKEVTKKFIYVILLLVVVILLVYAAYIIMPRRASRRLFPITQFGNKIVVPGQTMGPSGFSTVLNEKGDLLVATMKVNGVRTVVVLKKNDSKKTYDVLQKLVPSKQAVTDSNANLTAAISRDGKIILAGISDNANNAGQCWVFRSTDGVTWAETGTLLGSGATGAAGQGSSVAISGDGRTMAIGGPSDNSNIGAAWVFYDNVQVGQKLVSGATGATGPGATGATSLPGQGYALALSNDGQVLAVGSLNDGNGLGAVFIYMPAGASSAAWKLMQKIVGSGMAPIVPGAFTAYGGSISLSQYGEYIVVGASTENNGYGSVFTYKKERHSNIWHQHGKKSYPKYGVFDNEDISYGNVVSLSLDGEILAASANNDENVGKNDAVGATWISLSRHSNWKLESKLVGTGYVRKSGAGVAQGNTMNLSGDGKTLAVCGPADDANIGAIWVFVH